MPSRERPFSTLPVRRVEESPLDPMSRSAWPATIAPVRRLLDEGLDLGAVTVLVGDNGAGKSTLVEGIAMAFGMNAEGGSTGAMNATRGSESRLADHLRLVRGAGASRRGFFLRAASGASAQASTTTSISCATGVPSSMPRSGTCGM